MKSNLELQSINNNITIYDTECEKLTSLYENNFDNLLRRINSNDPKITHLDLRSGLTKLGFFELLKALKHNTVVTELTLRSTSFYDYNLSDEYAHTYLGKFLKTNSRLKSLVLFHTGIEDNGAKSLAISLKDNTNLTHLKISGHHIDQLGSLSLIEMLVFNKTLDKFILIEGGINNLARVCFIAQLPYLSVAELNVSGSLISMLLNRQDIKQISLLNRHKIKLDNNPLELKYTQTTLEEEKFLSLLQNNKFDNLFIERTKKLLQKFKSQEQKIIQRYPSSSDEEEKLTNIRESFKGDLYGKEFKQEIKKQKQSFTQLRAALIKEYIILQNEYNKYLEDLEDKFKKQIEVVSQLNDVTHKSEVLVEASDKKDEPHELTIVKEEIDIVDENLEKTSSSLTLPLQEPLTLLHNIKKEFNPANLISIVIPKAINIDQNLDTGILTDWLQQVLNRDDEFVVISLGSSKVKSQQIPNFTKNIKTSILNIDRVFNEEECNSASESATMKLDYIKIDAKDICVKNAIEILERNDKKIIFLSNISPTAGYYVCKEILQKNLQNYADNFIYINAYFKDTPALVCSKYFISNHINDNDDTMNILENIYNSPLNQEQLDNIIIANNYSNLGIFKYSLDAVTIDDIRKIMQAQQVTSHPNNNQLFT